jgi:hypothetical protein
MERLWAWRRSACDFTTRNMRNHWILEAAMADRSALGVIGLMLSGATLLVMMIGAVVVKDHLTGRLHIEDNLPVIALPVAAR